MTYPLCKLASRKFHLQYKTWRECHIDQRIFRDAPKRHQEHHLGWPVQYFAHAEFLHCIASFALGWDLVFYEIAILNPQLCL